MDLNLSKRKRKKKEDINQGNPLIFKPINDFV